MHPAFRDLWSESRPAPDWLQVRVGLLATRVLLGLLLATAGSAWALEPDKAPRQFPHRAWQTADGLPQNSVLSLAQTPDGYLWGGTWEGLVRFDGVRFTVFDKTNTPALQGRNIHDLAVDRDGTLWIGLEKGLVRMREGVFHPVVPPEGTVLAHPQKLLATRDGSLWIATAEHGLTRLAEGRFQTWRKADGLASDEPLALAEDASGGLWVASTGGLQRWDGTAWTAPLPFEGGPQVAVRLLAMDRDGHALGRHGAGDGVPAPGGPHAAGARGEPAGRSRLRDARGPRRRPLGGESGPGGAADGGGPGLGAGGGAPAGAQRGE